MSFRTVAVLGVVIVVCLAVLAASALAQQQLAATFGFLRDPELFRSLGFFGRRSFFPGELFRRQLAGWREVVAAFASYAFLFLAGMLTLFAFPRQMRLVRDAFGHGAGGQLQLLGIGAAAALALALLAVLGFFSLVVFPLALVPLLVLVLLAWAGMVALASSLGQAIGRWAGLARSSPVFDLALGTLVLFTLGRIPIAGGVLTALLGALALGAVLITHLGTGGAWSLAEFKPVEELHS